MSYLLIKPLDTLFFRGGKPFTKGEETVAETLTMPYPATVWGAMYSSLLLQGLIKNPLKEKYKLTLKRLYYYDINRKNIFVSSPLDIFRDDKKKLFGQSFIESKSLISNVPDSYNLIVPDFGNDTSSTVETAANHFVKLTDLVRHYLNHDNYRKIKLYSIIDILTTYNKIGIARSNDTRTSEEGNLYNAEMIELQEDLGFIVEFESQVNFPKKGILKLGGEGKMAAYEEIEEPYDIKSFKEELKKEFPCDLVKVYFETPAFIPNDFLERFTVEAVFLGKPISIGGFDMITGPKPMKKAIPPGSYYVLSCEENRDLSVWEDVVFNTLKNEKGFGAFQILPFKM